MRGLDIARAYWMECGRPMLEAQFPDLMPLLAAGLCGAGSECFGFDDALSRDHDFEPGFILFLPDEARVDRRRAFLLERACSKLPREFMGLRRGLMSPVGGARHGVKRIAEYFTEKTGAADGILTVGQWLSLPSHALAEAVNGEIFYDGSGEVTEIRRRLSRYPQDIRLKKLAGCLVLMGQAGQYNYPRCVRRGETGAAQLAAGEFTSRAMEAAFLLGDVYMPFYKWRFRALRSLPRLYALAKPMEALLSTGNDGETAQEKQRMIADIASAILAEMRAQGLNTPDGGDLERSAYAVNDMIGDPDLRNAHILSAV